MSLRVGIALVVAVGALAACSPGNEKSDDAPVETVVEKKAPTASDVVAAFEAANLPITEVKSFTEENDPNKQMGRPGGYLSKVNFLDSRHQSPDDMQDESTVEVFETEELATARREYVEQVTEGTPFLTQYIFQKGPIVLRLDRSLTPDQAKAYEAALMSEF